MITITEDIDVPCPPGRVWEVVSDPSQVVGCIRGAELGASHDDGSFDGALVVKFGAVRVKFGARIALDLDPESQEGHLTARGNDGQGATRYRANATFGVSHGPAAGTSRVGVRGDITLTGKLVPLIEAGAGAVISRMTKDFADELVRRCAGDEEVTVVPARRSWWVRLGELWRRLTQKSQSRREALR
ncbi:SRPBCC domain-containing protein [Nocardia vaccinii]|uniref:SRPBCC domain-containing protein n=1 Tax=Nocardia vaccinii TaxID=1822 RepID=UPI00082A5C22|nr:SRPBCC domain-containing protein [Nocardia vaccinii]